MGFPQRVPLATVSFYLCHCGVSRSLKGLEWKSPYEVSDLSCREAVDLMHRPQSARKAYYSHLIPDANPDLLWELQPLTPFVDAGQVHDSFIQSFALLPHHPDVFSPKPESELMAGVTRHISPLALRQFTELFRADHGSEAILVSLPAASLETVPVFRVASWPSTITS